MDKKKGPKNFDAEDLAGFEEFIEGQSGDGNFLPKQQNKKEVSFEYFTFLTNDSQRLLKLKNLLAEKLPFALKYEQGNQLLDQQKLEMALVKDKLFELNNKESSAYRRSLGEILDSFFAPPN